MAGEVPAPDRLLLLDSCVVLNLFATRHMVEIVTAVGGQVGMVSAVGNEVLWVYRGGDGEDAEEPELVEIEPLLSGGIVHIVQPTEAELEDFVVLTTRLDDGEAMTVAVAVARGWEVATDDRKARSALASRVRVWSTLDLVKGWADVVSLDADELFGLLRDLRQRGRYLPRRSDPHRSWWDQHFGDR